LPAYNDYLLRGKLAEAHGELAAMRTKLETYFLDNRQYTGACAANTVAPLPAGKYFTYTCPVLSATAYTVQAAGVAAQGTGGFTYTIDQANTRATTAVPSGWTTNATCWVTKKGGTC
jgi:type IV pilus assembly protein PilE